MLDDTNSEAWAIFVALTSQMILGGMGGVVGVNLLMFPLVCDMRAIPAEERPVLFDKVCICNRIGVSKWNTKTKE